MPQSALLLYTVPLYLHNTSFTISSLAPVFQPHQPLTVPYIYKLFDASVPFHVQCPLSGSPLFFLPVAVSTTLTNLKKRAHVFLEETSLPHTHGSLPAGSLQPLNLVLLSVPALTLGYFLCPTHLLKRRSVYILAF